MSSPGEGFVDITPDWLHVADELAGVILWELGHGGLESEYLPVLFAAFRFAQHQAEG